MGFKCCVTGCASNYRLLKKRASSLPRKCEDTENLPPCKRRKDDPTHVPVFSLPKDEAEKEIWLKNIPRSNTPVTKHTRICYLHWPPNFPSKPCQGGHVRPIHPPTVFENCDIPQSTIPTPCPPPRTTSRALSSVRNVEVDPIIEFNARMTVNFGSIVGTIHQFIENVISYKHEDTVYIQSVEFSAGAVHKFLVKIFSDLSYEAYQSGVRCFVTPLKANKIYRLEHWSQIEICVNYLNTQEPDHKVKILEEDINSLCNLYLVGKKVYPIEKVLRSFEYFATSRAAYNQLLNDYQLPSVSMLNKLTSKSTSMSELEFIENVLKSLPEHQRKCNILVDEVCVKPQLLYHGGQLFGKAINHPSELATSVLAVMIVCLNGGPKFVAKLIPVTKLTGEYQFSIVKNIIKVITKSGGVTVSIICDDNKVNQKFMKLMPSHPNHPYVTIESEEIPPSIHLLFDFVHLFKSIRNNWYTEKMKEISFHHPNMESSKVAKWINISDMFRLDSDRPVMKFAHKLTSVAVAPKPIERQNVNYMLKIFCDETIAALRAHPNLNRLEIEPTAEFLEMWVEIWLMLNVKKPHVDIRLNDKRRAEFRDTRDDRLTKFEEIAQMVERMESRNGKYFHYKHKFFYDLFEVLVRGKKFAFVIKIAVTQAECVFICLYMWVFVNLLVGFPATP